MHSLNVFETRSLSASDTEGSVKDDSERQKKGARDTDMEKNSGREEKGREGGVMEERDRIEKVENKIDNNNRYFGGISE